ncbi:MAG: response regulator [Candidatus Omnitrophota bacterium]
MRGSVLIVDRKMDYAQELSALLKGAGLGVDVIHSSDSICALHKEYVYNAIFVDFESYALREPSFIREIKGIKPDTKIIIVKETPLIHDRMLKNAIKCGICGLISKPFDKDKILDMFCESKNSGKTEELS